MSCFDEVLYGDLDGTMAVIPELKRVIAERKAEPEAGQSYTNKLLADEDKRLKKVVEEAGEVILAVKGHRTEGSRPGRSPTSSTT